MAETGHNAAAATHRCGPHAWPTCLGDTATGRPSLGGKPVHAFRRPTALCLLARLTARALCPQVLSLAGVPLDSAGVAAIGSALQATASLRALDVTGPWWTRARVRALAAAAARRAERSELLIFLGSHEAWQMDDDVPFGGQKLGGHGGGIGGGDGVGGHSNAVVASVNGEAAAADEIEGALALAAVASEGAQSEAAATFEDTARAAFSGLRFSAMSWVGDSEAFAVGDKAGLDQTAAADMHALDSLLSAGTHARPSLPGASP